MTRARRELVSLDNTRCYHCTTLCVRRALRWTSWIGHISTDILKITIAGAAAYLTGISFAVGATAGTVALLPLGAALVVAIAVGAAMNHLDKHFRITESLIAALEKKEQDIVSEAGRGLYIIITNTGRAITKQLQRSATEAIGRALYRLPRTWQ